jgi:hypothetical protein
MTGVTEVDDNGNGEVQDVTHQTNLLRETVPVVFCCAHLRFETVSPQESTALGYSFLLEKDPRRR